MTVRLTEKRLRALTPYQRKILIYRILEVEAYSYETVLTGDLHKERSLCLIIVRKFVSGYFVRSASFRKKASADA